MVQGHGERGLLPEERSYSRRGTQLPPLRPPPYLPSMLQKGHHPPPIFPSWGPLGFQGALGISPAQGRSWAIARLRTGTGRGMDEDSPRGACMGHLQEGRGKGEEPLPLIPVKSWEAEKGSWHI